MKICLTNIFIFLNVLLIYDCLGGKRVGRFHSCDFELTWVKKSTSVIIK